MIRYLFNLKRGCSFSYKGYVLDVHEPARVAEPGGHQRQVHEAGLQAGEAHEERAGMKDRLLEFMIQWLLFGYKLYHLDCGRAF